MLRTTFLAFTTLFLVAQSAPENPPKPKSSNQGALQTDNSTPIPAKSETRKVDPTNADQVKTEVSITSKPETVKVDAVKTGAAKTADGKKTAKNQGKASKSKVSKEEESASEPPTPKEDKILARIGTKDIRDSDFDAFSELVLPPQQRLQLAMVPEARERFFRQFIDFQVMEAKACKDGLDKKEEVQKKCKIMKGQVLMQELIKRDGPELQKKVVVNDPDVKAYYEKHIDDFKTKATFNARHILVSVKEGDKEKTDEAAKAKIAKIQEELKAGKKLQDLAKEYSDDPGSKDKGGLYENITYGTFVPSFDEAVKKQEIGKPGEPVKSNFGYHIIQVEKRTESETKPFDSVKDQCKQKATEAKREEVFENYINDLKKEIEFKEIAEAVKPEVEIKPENKTTEKPN